MSKRSVIQTNDGYLMLLDAVYFNGRRMGNISEEGLDWGGEDGLSILSAGIPIPVSFT